MIDVRGIDVNWNKSSVSFSHHSDNDNDKMHCDKFLSKHFRDFSLGCGIPSRDLLTKVEVTPECYMTGNHFVLS